MDKRTKKYKELKKIARELSETLDSQDFLESQTEWMLEEVLGYIEAENVIKNFIENCDNADLCDYIDNLSEHCNKEQLAKLILDCSEAKLISDYYIQWNEVASISVEDTEVYTEDLVYNYDLSDSDQTTLMTILKNEFGIGEYVYIGGLGDRWVFKVCTESLEDELKNFKPESSKLILKPSTEEVQTEAKVFCLESYRTKKGTQPHRFYSDAEYRNWYAKTK